MKKIVCVAAGMACVGMAFGEVSLPNGYVQPNGVITNDVPDGESIGFSGVVVPGDRTILKRGGGTLAVDRAKLDQTQPVKFAIAEGKVTVSDSKVSPGNVATLPQTVKDKLIFWGSAKDSAHIINADGAVAAAGDSVEKWYDVRETDIANPKYAVMVSNHTNNPAGSGNVWPTLTTLDAEVYFRQTNSWQSIYFGGRGSRKFMTLMKDSKPEMTAVYSAMVAHTIVNPANVGAMVGAYSAELSPFSPYIAWPSDATTYLSPWAWSSVAQGENYLDGQRFDAGADAVTAGHHIVEFVRNVNESSSNGVRHNAIFSNTYGEDVAARGGDGISEYMIFRQRLTENERLLVEYYLNQQWPGRGNPATAKFALAAGTTAEVTADDTVSNLLVQATGEGTLVKKGCGRFDLMSEEANDVDPAQLKIEGGSVAMRRMHPLKLAAGDSVTVDYSSYQNVVTVENDAGSGTIVKKGAGTATLTKVPEDVKRIEVQAGTLALGGGFSGKKGEAQWGGEVYIENNGFEDFDNGDDPCINLSTSSFVAGWKLAYKGDGGCWMANVPEWKDTTKRTSGTAYGCTQEVYQGSCALHIKIDARPFTMVTIPEAGEYEFSCWLSCRAKHMMLATGAKLTDDSGNTVVDFGIMRASSADVYVRRALRANVTTPGTYRLQLENVNNLKVLPTYKEDGKTVTAHWDLSSMWDDIHLRKVGPVNNGEWLIPNGDFEGALIPNVAECSYSAWQSIEGHTSTDHLVFGAVNNNVEGWTFETLAGWSGSQLPVGIVTPLIKLIMGRGNGDAFLGKMDSPYDGAVEVLFKGNGGKLTTTFTPPEGTWYLTAYLGNKHSPNKSGSLKASVTIGEDTTELGSLSSNAKRLEKRVWPTAFTVDGSTAVKLTLEHETSYDENNGIVADMFVLSKAGADEGELLPQGVIRKSTMGTKDSQNKWISVNGVTRDTEIATGHYHTWTMMRNIVESPTAFGTDPVDGWYFFELWSDSGAYTDFTLPKAGRYRLAYLTRRRFNSIYSAHPEVSVIRNRDSVTNVVDSYSIEPRGSYEQRVVYFSVSEGGSYRLLFKGTNMYRYAYSDIGGVSIRAADEGEDTEVVANDKMTVKVAEGAKLRLDCSEPQTVGRVILGGVSVQGEVSKDTYPDYVFGEGELTVVPRGFILSIR